MGWVGICQGWSQSDHRAMCPGSGGVLGRERAEVLPLQSAAGCPTPMWDRILNKPAALGHCLLRAGPVAPPHPTPTFH